MTDSVECVWANIKSGSGKKKKKSTKMKMKKKSYKTGF